MNICCIFWRFWFDIISNKLSQILSEYMFEMDVDTLIPKKSSTNGLSHDTLTLNTCTYIENGHYGLMSKQKL